MATDPDERRREPPELPAEKLVVRAPPPPRQIEREHALVGLQKIAEHRAHALQGVTGVWNQNRLRRVETA